MNCAECYEILGLKYGCSQEELKKAYKKQIILNHPDKHIKEEKKYEEKTRKIIEAYNYLKDNLNEKPEQENKQTSKEENKKTTYNTNTNYKTENTNYKSYYYDFNEDYSQKVKEETKKQETKENYFDIKLFYHNLKIYLIIKLLDAFLIGFIIMFVLGFFI